jgi:glycosyltransferase involved in cell wall biosynthesis
MSLTILLIGNFLSKTTGSQGVSEELAEHLERATGKKPLTASPHQNRFLRMMDIIHTVLLKRSQYDVANVEVYSGMAFIWAEIAARLLHWLRKPFILTLHGGGLPLLAKKSPARLYQTLSLANAVTTPSHYVQEKLLSLRSDILYLPNGLNLKNYSFQTRGNPRPKLCWLRAFHAIYNPALAIQTVILLRKKFPDIHLTMIGPDKKDGTFEAAQKIVSENQLGECVEFISAIRKEDVPHWLAKSDIFLNTTSLESFGVAVMEAGAAGLPIVTTNAGELPLLWSHEEDALLVPLDDPQAMARAVTRILTEDGLAERLSQNARAKAEQYDWSVILPTWQHLFVQVMEK